jgi:hypothetical protein
MRKTVFNECRYDESAVRMGGMMRVMIMNIAAIVSSRNWNASILQSASDAGEHAPVHVLPSSDRPNLFSGD